MFQSPSAPSSPFGPMLVTQENGVGNAVRFRVTVPPFKPTFASLSGAIVMSALESKLSGRSCQCQPLTGRWLERRGI
jgi:hypothetical protein